MADALTVVAVGDISLGDHPMCIGRGVGSRLGRLGPDAPLYPFEHVGSLFAGADMVFGNLETALGDRGLRPAVLQSVEMRGPSDGGDRLRRAGFTVLNIANNHILQHGAECFADTVAACADAGLAVVGVADPSRAGTQPVVVTCRGTRVAWLGYAFEPDKYFAGTPIYAFGPACDIAADIRAAREHADLVLCSMHWGEEFIRYPSRHVQAIGRAAIQAGAHLVLGHHPHVVQGIETFQHGAIAYSLGNFAFDMSWHSALRTGLVLRVTLDHTGLRGIEPGFVDIGDDFQPRAVVGSRLQAHLDDLAAMSGRLADLPDDDVYRREYEGLVSKNRRQAYSHALKRAAEYPPATLARILVRPLARRFS